MRSLLHTQQAVPLHATSGSCHLGVLLILHLLVGEKLGPHSTGLGLELVLSVLAVLGELLADSGEGLVELESHLVELIVGGLLVLGNKVLELSIVLEVLDVTVVSELHHAGHLSVHVGVHLSLLGSIGADDTSGLVDTGVHLGNLLLHGGGEGKELNLELGGGSICPLLGLLLGSGDVGHGLGVTLVLKRLLGVEGGLEAHGGALEGHVNLLTVLGHLGLDILELSRGGGNKTLDLVGSPCTGSLVLGSELLGELAAGSLGVLTELHHLVVPASHGGLEVLAGLLGVLLDLGSVGGNVLVHAVNASIGGGCPSSGGLLPAIDSKLEVLGGLALVVVDKLVGALVATKGGLVATVGKVGLLDETLLGAGHSVVEVIAGLLGVLRHLVQHVPLELGAGGSVEGKVTGHLGTDRCDVGLTVGNLITDLLLNIVEVVHQAHAAVRGLSVDLASLEHVSAANAGANIHCGGTVALDDLVHVLIASIGGDVHHGAADGKPAKERECHARVGHLLSRG